MPKFQIETQDDVPHLTLQDINHQEIIQAKKMISAIKFHDVHRIRITANHWIAPITALVFLLLFGIIVTTKSLLKKTQARKTNGEAINITLELQPREAENRQPLFSKLTEGGVMYVETVATLRHVEFYIVE
ncbi:hypothetical protein GWI33_004122 [Rhynchophorus ferrugineus]|uniref:Uncharacterized protein n=1 Tax=Rhynchophorus ferrugineus TaxID=354439 RepID=A0A834HI48_RHYFE|nr:hypothetical protein GWI33_004123 [Rhynchophorus ferrugineus]KAF7262788.1 hypothetical protein GWI33_004122 [Rhynchophorus ferrugineus]